MFQAMIHGKRSVLNWRSKNSPRLHLVVFEDSATGYKFISGSTATSRKPLNGKMRNEYPLVRVEVTSDSHPFYTGKQKFTQADGAVDKFNKKYGFK